ncbi:MAG: endolytic transglycosylase MltG [Gaiellaceae bacterium]
MVYFRRLVALALLAGGLAGGYWVVSNALARGEESKPEQPVVSSKPLRIVFPEGFTRRQMAERITAVDLIARRKRNVNILLSARAYLRSTASSKLPSTYADDDKRRPLEGFLFPATYDFLARTSTSRLIRDQLRAFNRNWRKVNLRYARSKNLTAYDVLIIASMIEKEVIAPEERKLVSAVIYNRLRARMPLGIDATIRYALDVPPTKSLTRSQLRHPTRYNTRRYRGLVPTPIANPGLASMQAAARPADVDYLYFVRKPDRIHHFFTASYAEFQEYLRRNGYPTDA